MILRTVKIEKDFFVCTLSPSSLDSCLDIQLHTLAKEGLEKCLYFLWSYQTSYPSPCRQEVLWGKKNNGVSPLFCFHCGSSFSLVLPTGKQNSCLPHWQILEDCYLLISLFFLRLNKSHFFVFLFGANFHINFYSFNFFDLLGIPSKFSISVLRALN